MGQTLAITPDDIAQAARRLAPYAVRTPLIHHPRLDERTGAQVFLKPECLQHTGSFKFRGAMNSLLCLSEAARAKGVLAWSSGNHGQAVARAAHLLGTQATIVMPKDAPALKLAATKAHGAEIITYDRFSEDREKIGKAIAAKTGKTIIPPYDYEPTIAGQGTVGLEIACDLSVRRVAPDYVLCCCGGGGLVAGTAMALKGVWPDAQIYAVEPDGFDDTRQSLAQGKRVPHAPDQTSICDALLAPIPGELTFPIHQRFLAGGIAVSDEAVLHAMAVAFRHLKLVLEPGGAVALAALLERVLPVKGKTVVVILSGGNVDAELFGQALEKFPEG